MSSWGGPSPTAWGIHQQFRLSVYSEEKDQEETVFLKALQQHLKKGSGLPINPRAPTDKTISFWGLEKPELGY